MTVPTHHRTLPGPAMSAELEAAFATMRTAPGMNLNEWSREHHDADAVLFGDEGWSKHLQPFRFLYLSFDHTQLDAIIGGRPFLHGRTLLEPCVYAGGGDRIHLRAGSASHQLVQDSHFVGTHNTVETTGWQTTPLCGKGGRELCSFDDRCYHDLAATTMYFLSRYESGRVLDPTEMLEKICDRCVKVASRRYSPRS